MVNKFTTQPTNKEVVDKINDVIDAMGSTQGANIDLSNLSATGESKFQAPLVSGTNIKTINSTSILGSGNISVLQNTATGLLSLTILGTAQTTGNGTNVGYSTSAGQWSNAFGNNAKATGRWSEVFGGNITVSGDWSVGIGHNNDISGNYTVAIGANLGGSSYETTGNYATCLGCYSNATADSTIQIGYGINSTANSLSIGFYNNSTTHYNWQLLDGTTGLIPDGRISSNIARTSDIPDSEIFIAEYGVTSYSDITNAVSAGKRVVCHNFYNPEENLWLNYFDANTDTYYFSGSYKNILLNATVDSDNNWGGDSKSLADTNLSNLSATGKTVLDGQWVVIGGNEAILTDASLKNSSGTAVSKTATSIPNDGNVYEALFRGSVTTGSTSGNYLRLQFRTNAFGNTVQVCGARTRSASTVFACGTVIVPIMGGSNNLTIDRNADYNGTADFTLMGYRRVGTNT